MQENAQVSRMDPQDVYRPACPKTSIRHANLCAYGIHELVQSAEIPPSSRAFDPTAKRDRPGTGGPAWNAAQAESVDRHRRSSSPVVMGEPAGRHRESSARHAAEEARQSTHGREPGLAVWRRPCPPCRFAPCLFVPWLKPRSPPLHLPSSLFPLSLSAGWRLAVGCWLDRRSCQAFREFLPFCQPAVIDVAHSLARHKAAALRGMVAR